MRLPMVLAAALLLAGAARAQVTPTPPPRTITVSGTAQRQATPDLGIVVLAVQTQDARVTTATEQNNRLSARVMEAIRALNIPNLAMRTLGFDVQPMYEQPAQGRPAPTPPRIIGYQVINRIEGRITNADPTQLASAVGRVLDAALNAGANRVDSVQFILQNDQPVMRDVLADATRNAMALARTLADAADVEIVRLLSLSSTPYYQPMPVFARAAEAAQAVPIVIGPMTVQGTVNAVFEVR